VTKHVEKTKYMFVSYHRNAGQNHEDDKCFENMTKLRYL